MSFLPIIKSLTFSFSGQRKSERTFPRLVSHIRWETIFPVFVFFVKLLPSSAEVHPGHVSLNPDCSCVNNRAHATGSADTDNLSVYH